MKSDKTQLHIRLNKSQMVEIKIAAIKNNVSVTDYILGCSLPGKSLSKVIDQQIVSEVIELRTNIGKTTGMLKVALNKGIYNPVLFAKILKAYSYLNTETLNLISRCSEKIERL